MRCEANGYTAVVGDFGLAEKIPTYRSVCPYPSSNKRFQLAWGGSWGVMGVFVGMALVG